MSVNIGREIFWFYPTGDKVFIWGIFKKGIHNL